MATKRMIAREVKREKLATGAKRARAELKAKIIDANLSFDERMEAAAKLASRKVDESPSRQTTRCIVCGRPHAVYNRFGLCRIHLREYFHKGWLPGLQKSSW